jgi:hypothetical protein
MSVAADLQYNVENKYGVKQVFSFFEKKICFRNGTAKERKKNWI